MNRQTLVFAGVVVLGYWAFLKWRGVIDGPPWSPVPAMAGPRSATS